MPRIAAITEEHVEGAAFLWACRETAVRAAEATLTRLARNDERLEAHLDGVRFAGDEGLDLALAAAASGGAPGVFTAALLAVEREEPARIDAAVEAGTRSNATSRGLVAALAWLPWPTVRPVARTLLEAESPALRRVALAAYAVRRHDLKGPLEDALSDPDPALAARACKAVGELGRQDLLPTLRDLLGAEDEGVRFWAAWAAALVGDVEIARELGGITSSGGIYAERACDLGIRLFDEDYAMRALEELAAVPGLERMTTRAAGACGHVGAVPILLAEMEMPAAARVAAEAFTTITGLDLEQARMTAGPPEGFDAGPTDDPADEHVAPDPDENLPWPDVARVRQWWVEHRREFVAGRRYLLGQPISAEWLRACLLTARQRQRTAAALELALMQPGAPLFETRAAAPRQYAQLER